MGGSVLTRGTGLRRRVVRLVETTKVGVYIELVNALVSTAAAALYVVEAYAIEGRASGGAAASQAVLDTLATVELWLSGFFILDFVFRVYISRPAWRYVLSMAGIIDILTIVPVVLGATDVDVGDLSFLSLARVLRILRIVRVHRTFAYVESEVTRSLLKLGLSVMSLVFVAAGVFHAVENILVYRNSGELDYFTAVYFIVVSVSTVGFGDVQPASAPGRAIVLVMICAAVVLLPMETNSFLRVMQSASQYTSARYFPPRDPTRRAMTVQVLVCGDVRSSGVGTYFRELLHEDHGGVRVHVVVLSPKPPSPYLKAILDDVVMGPQITFLQGSPLIARDMARAHAHTCDGAFVLVNKFSQRPETEDAAAMLTALAVKRYVWMHEQRDAHLYLQLIRPESKRHFMATLPASMSLTVVCTSQLTMNLLAMATAVPAVTTLLFNLLSSDETHSLGSSAPPWLKEYLAGASFEVYRTSLSKVYANLPFNAAAALVYAETGVLLFGLELTDTITRSAAPDAVSRILLNPGSMPVPNYRGIGVRAFVVARDKTTADLIGLDRSRANAASLTPQARESLTRLERGLRALRSDTEAAAEGAARSPVSLSVGPARAPPPAEAATGRQVTVPSRPRSAAAPSRGPHPMLGATGRGAAAEPGGEPRGYPEGWLASLRRVSVSDAAAGGGGRYAPAHRGKSPPRRSILKRGVAGQDSKAAASAVAGQDSKAAASAANDAGRAGMASKADAGAAAAGGRADLTDDARAVAGARVAAVPVVSGLPAVGGAAPSRVSDAGSVGPQPLVRSVSQPGSVAASSRTGAEGAPASRAARRRRASAPGMVDLSVLTSAAGRARPAGPEAEAAVLDGRSVVRQLVAARRTRRRSMHDAVKALPEVSRPLTLRSRRRLEAVVKEEEDRQRRKTRRRRRGRRGKGRGGGSSGSSSRSSDGSSSEASSGEHGGGAGSPGRVAVGAGVASSSPSGSGRDAGRGPRAADWAGSDDRDRAKRSGSTWATSGTAGAVLREDSRASLMAPGLDPLAAGEGAVGLQMGERDARSSRLPAGSFYRSAVAAGADSSGAGSAGSMAHGSSGASLRARPHPGVPPRPERPSAANLPKAPPTQDAEPSPREGRPTTFDGAGGPGGDGAAKDDTGDGSTAHGASGRRRRQSLRDRMARKLSHAKTVFSATQKVLKHMAMRRKYRLRQVPADLAEATLHGDEDASELQGHIVVCGAMTDLVHFVAPLRLRRQVALRRRGEGPTADSTSHVAGLSAASGADHDPAPRARGFREQKSLGHVAMLSAAERRPIVLLHPHPPSAREWETVAHFADVWYVRGTPLNYIDLRRARLHRAAYAVVLSARGSSPLAFGLPGGGGGGGGADDGGGERGGAGVGGVVDTAGGIDASSLVDAEALFFAQSVFRTAEAGRQRLRAALDDKERRDREARRTAGRARSRRGSVAGGHAVMGCRVICELVDGANVSYLRPDTSHFKARWYLQAAMGGKALEDQSVTLEGDASGSALMKAHPNFASGAVMTAGMLDALLVQAFYNPAAIVLLERLLLGSRSAREEPAPDPDGAATRKGARLAGGAPQQRPDAGLSARFVAGRGSGAAAASPGSARPVITVPGDEDGGGGGLEADGSESEPPSTAGGAAPGGVAWPGGQGLSVGRAAAAGMGAGGGGGLQVTGAASAGMAIDMTDAEPFSGGGGGWSHGAGVGEDSSQMSGAGSAGGGGSVAGHARGGAQWDGSVMSSDMEADEAEVAAMTAAGAMGAGDIGMGHREVSAAQTPMERAQAATAGLHGSQWSVRGGGVAGLLGGGSGRGSEASAAGAASAAHGSHGGDGSHRRVVAPRSRADMMLATPLGVTPSGGATPSDFFRADDVPGGSGSASGSVGRAVTAAGRVRRSSAGGAPAASGPGVAAVSEGRPDKRRGSALLGALPRWLRGKRGDAASRRSSAGGDTAPGISKLDSRRRLAAEGKGADLLGRGGTMGRGSLASLAAGGEAEAAGAAPAVAVTGAVGAGGPAAARVGRGHRTSPTGSGFGGVATPGAIAPFADRGAPMPAGEALAAGDTRAPMPTSTVLPAGPQGREGADAVAPARIGGAGAAADSDWEYDSDGEAARGRDTTRLGRVLAARLPRGVSGARIMMLPVPAWLAGSRYAEVVRSLLLDYQIVPLGAYRGTKPRPPGRHRKAQIEPYVATNPDAASVVHPWDSLYCVCSEAAASRLLRHQGGFLEGSWRPPTRAANSVAASSVGSMTSTGGMRSRKSRRRVG